MTLLGDGYQEVPRVAHCDQEQHEDDSDQDRFFPTIQPLGALEFSQLTM